MLSSLDDGVGDKAAQGGDEDTYAETGGESAYSDMAGAVDAETKDSNADGYMELPEETSDNGYMDIPASEFDTFETNGDV